MKFRLILNFVVVIVLVVLTAEYGGRNLGIIETLEKTSFDWRISATAENARKYQDIVIIDIDRNSLRTLGDWPWRRDLLAKMLDQLFGKYSARVAAFAFPFSTPDDTSLLLSEDIRNRLMADEDIDTKERWRLRSAFDEIKEELSYDKIFMSAMEERLVFLGYLFDETGHVQGTLPSPEKFYDSNDSSKEILPEQIRSATRKWSFLRGYSGNTSEILTAAVGAGHINNYVDEDGQVRRMPLMVKNGGLYYKSLPLAILQRENASTILPLLINRQDDKIVEIAVGRHRARVNDDGVFFLNYMGRGGRNTDFESERDAVFRYVSAVDLIRGNVPKSFLDDKICIIGSSSEQLRDLHSTPVNPELSGAELLATQLANIIDGRTLVRPASAFFEETFILVVVALLLAAIFVFVGPLLSLLLTLLASGGAVFIAINQWNVNFEVLRLTPPLFVFIGLFLFNAISGFVIERRASRQLKDTFGHYVPPELAKQIGKTISMEGESREISVLFSDIRDFTSISETFSPADLTKLMNRMLTGQTEMIYRHGGTVDKFIGDAVMAFWNAPLDDEKHAQNSVKAAIDMQKNISLLSLELEKTGRQPMRLGVGICSGEANVGNMGSQHRVAYTAMGDTVNVASRVEGLTKKYETPILVTDTTRRLCGDEIVFRAVDVVRVKGRIEPLAIYEPLVRLICFPWTLCKRLKYTKKCERPILLVNLKNHCLYWPSMSAINRMTDWRTYTKNG